VVADTLTGAPDSASLSIFSASPRRGATRGRFPITCTATFPTMSGHNPTLTLQALAYYAAEAIVNRYIRNPGPLV